jgi:hypothetical protein
MKFNQNISFLVLSMGLFFMLFDSAQLESLLLQEDERMERIESSEIDEIQEGEEIGNSDEYFHDNDGPSNLSSIEFNFRPETFQAYLKTENSQDFRTVSYYIMYCRLKLDC